MFNNSDKKFSKSSSYEYQEFLAHEKIELARILSLLAFVLYGCFAIVDYFALKSAFNVSLVIRLSVMMVLAVSYALTYFKHYIRYYSLIHCVKFFAAIIGVEAMIYLATPGDQAYSSYYAGLIIVMIALFSWTHLKLIFSATLALSALFGYLYIEMYIRDFTHNGTTSTVVINMFFYCGAIIFGLLAQVQRDKHLRHNFLLQQSLKEAFDKKSIEARDNQYLANHDPLTDLPNRRYMTELLNKSLDEASQKNKVLVIMFIDLNGFKKVNDLYGHNAGDEVLMIVAKRLELAIRKGDHLSRLGGDEYLLGLLMDKENLDEVETMANKFIHIISQSMNVEGLRIKIGASIGLAAYPIHGNNIEALMAIADQRMYKAKRRNSRGEIFEGSSLNKKEESVVIFPGNTKSKTNF